jgi:hypothetical protein
VITVFDADNSAPPSDSGAGRKYGPAEGGWGIDGTAFGEQEFSAPAAQAAAARTAANA